MKRGVWVEIKKLKNKCECCGIEESEKLYILSIAENIIIICIDCINKDLAPLVNESYLKLIKNKGD